MQGHSGWVNAVSFSRDDKYIVSGGDDKLINIWNSETFKLIRSFDSIITTIILYLT